MTELERYKKALEVAKAAMKECSEIIAVQGAQEFRQRALGEINAILNPPPAVETVPLEQWAVVAPSGFVETTFHDKALADKAVSEDGIYHGYNVVKLTGNLTREVQKVERSVSVEAAVSGAGIAYAPNVHARPEFRDYPECHGKTGTLTFVWEE